MKFSIIIPVFNSEKYIESCINSVLSQDLQDFEIIVINDGSTDCSLKILESFAAKDERLKIYSINNSGNGFARNLGLEKAEGEYIFFIDSDDFIDKETLSFYEKIFSSTDCDLIYNTHKRVRESGEPFQARLFLIFMLDKLNCFDINFDFSKKHLDKVYSLDKCIDFASQKTLTMLWAGCYKRAFLKKNNIKLIESKSYEDIIFGMKVFSKNPKIAFANSPFYNYRENLSSLSFQSTNNNSHENISLNILKWINVSNEMEKIYIDSRINILGNSWEKYCYSALVFCVNSAINELQKYGYIDSKFCSKVFLKDNLIRLSKYVSVRKKFLAKYPLIMGAPKRFTRRVQNVFGNA